jgi:hypothetical protein
MESLELHPLYRQVGEVLNGLKMLAETIDLRLGQAEKLYDLIRADATSLRQNQRDMDEKLDCVVCVMQHDLEHLRENASHSQAAIADLLAAVQALTRPVSEIMTLRARAAGLMVGISVLGSAMLWLAEPVYRWFVVDRILKR